MKALIYAPLTPGIDAIFEKIIAKTATLHRLKSRRYSRSKHR